MSRGEGELLTVQKPRAVGLLPVCLTMKPVGGPDALIGHVRFDERGWETERCRMAQATAPILDSTFASNELCAQDVRNLGMSGLAADAKSTRMTRSRLRRAIKLGLVRERIRYRSLQAVNLSGRVVEHLALL